MLRIDLQVNRPDWRQQMEGQEGLIIIVFRNPIHNPHLREQCAQARHRQHPVYLLLEAGTALAPALHALVYATWETQRDLIDALGRLCAERLRDGKSRPS